MSASISVDRAVRTYGESSAQLVQYWSPICTSPNSVVNYVMAVVVIDRRRLGFMFPAIAQIVSFFLRYHSVDGQKQVRQVEALVVSRFRWFLVG